MFDTLIYSPEAKATTSVIPSIPTEDFIEIASSQMTELSLSSEQSVKSPQAFQRITSHSPRVGCFAPPTQKCAIDHGRGRGLPIFGLNPCTAYCGSCRREVHTQVELTEEVTWPRALLKFLGFLNCCSSYTWFNTLLAHKCPHCQEILANC